MTTACAVRRRRRASLGVGLLVLDALCSPLSRAVAQPDTAERPMPPITAEFARLVPSALARATRCRRADATGESAGAIRSFRLSCAGRTPPTEHGAPFITFIDLDADGLISHFVLEWTVAGSLGEDSLRTAPLDSAYADAQAFVGKQLGAPPMICRNTPLWRTSRGILVATPPRRQRMHSTPSYPPQPPGPEYASWALVLNTSSQLPPTDQCTLPSAPRR